MAEDFGPPEVVYRDRESPKSKRRRVHCWTVQNEMCPGMDGRTHNERFSIMPILEIRA